MSTEPTRQTHSCPRCVDGQNTLTVRRISRVESGYVDIFHCESCGYMNHADVPHEAPKD